MSSMLPSDKNNGKKSKSDPFGEWMRSVNEFLNEKPVRGFLQTIDDFFKNPFPLTSSFMVETVETENEYVVSAELPGVKRNQIHIQTFGNYLTISVENNELITEEDEKNQLYRRRHSFQKASRTISLPQPINEKRIKASYRDGLLQIRIPREKGKTIEIGE